MKIIILSICVFIMLRNTFSLSPQQFISYPESQGSFIFYFRIHWQQKKETQATTILCFCLKEDGPWWVER